MRTSLHHLAWPAACSLLGAGPILGQCAHDVCGYWYSENYNGGVQVEYVSIDMDGELLVCTKVLGDPYVPTGHVTWQGVPYACSFSGQVFATTGIGQPIFPLGATITILSADHIRVTGPFYLDFFRSTTSHLDFVGVDYSDFPVSCIDCPSPFPNVFTPNGDGMNDMLEPICGANAYRFAIVDRWGKTMFESTDPKPAWDGRQGWSLCPEGVYYWAMIPLDDRFGPIRRGTVQLLR
jgi:gliding motility-associated-like protein